MGGLFAACFVLSFPGAFAHATDGGRAALVLLALAVITAQAGYADRLSLAKYIAAPLASACTVLEARASSEGTLALALGLVASVAAVAGT